MIYIVEDDANIRELESYALQSSGFSTACFENGESFFDACSTDLPELVLLDIMLPNEDGLSILKKMRSHPDLKQVPVIMVTAKTSELDKVKGLDSGADDYMTKPFGVMELLSRVKALLRRAAPQKQDILSAGGVTVDDSKHLVTAGGKVRELTYKEYELLKFLMLNRGIVLSRDKIMERVWGFDYEGESRTVDMHIKTLRQKLGESGALIKTVRNVGYKFSD